MTHVASIPPFSLVPPLPNGIQAPSADRQRVPTPEALAFVSQLARRFTDGVDAALARRADRRARIVAGCERLDFLPETADIRRRDWKVAPVPQDLQCRVVEITGPTDRKM